MPTQDITVREYVGSLANANLLTDDPTLLLTAFSGEMEGTLADNDGTLGSDDTQSTFEGDDITYVGSGTAQPGVEALGVIVPLGTPVPVIVFEANGATYFHYPEGEPFVTGIVALILDIEDTPGEVFPNPYEGTTADDIYVGDFFDNTMTGRQGDDRLEGGGGDDRMFGGADSDTLYGDDGNDVMVGNSGNDSMYGGNGDDYISSGSEADFGVVCGRV